MKKIFKGTFMTVCLAALAHASCGNFLSSGSPPENMPPLTVEAGYMRLKVSWAAVEGAGSYELWYGPAPDGSEQSLDTKDTSALITGLQNGVEYSVRVRPKNAHGLGPWSEAVRGTPVNVRKIPQNLVVEEGDGSLTLSWDTLWDAASYQVFYSAPNANPGILDKLKCAEEPEEGYITINLDDYLYRYRVWVRAKYDGGSTGEYSAAGEGKIYKLITTELFDMGYFLDNPPPSVIKDSVDDPYRIVLKDFYATVTELGKLAAYTKGKYVDLDMEGLTNLWVTIFAPLPENRDKFVSIVFPRDIENIPDHCCDYMSNLRRVVLPEGLKRIGNHAFNHCGNLPTFTSLPPELEYIGEYSVPRLRYPGLTAVLPPVELAESAIGVIYNEVIDLSNVKSMSASSIGSNYVKAVIINRRDPPLITMEKPVLNHWNYYNDPTWYNRIMDRWGWDYYPDLCTLHAPINNGLQSYSPGNYGFPPESNVYVPDDRLETYQTAPGWKTYHDGPMALLNYEAVFTLSNAGYPSSSTAGTVEPVLRSRYKPLSELPAEYR